MIKYKLDNEDGLNLDDLIGYIAIDDRANIIELKDTYIDSFLESLLEGVTNVHKSKKISIELIEEPGALEMNLIGSTLTIMYQDRSVSFNFDDLIIELKKTIKKFLDKIDDSKVDGKNSSVANSISNIKRYLNEL